MAQKQTISDEASAGTVLIARICHEANAAYCRAIGDMSQAPWDAAPAWQKESAVNGVQFHIANPDAGDAASHENWLKVKEADGWKFGETKDEKKKLHPCMVPFDQLPPEQQAKDALFRSIVHSAAPLGDLVDRVAMLELQVEDLEADNRKLKRSVTAQKGQTTRVRTALAQAEARIREAGEEPREVPDDFELIDLGALELMVREAAGLELVAFDGRREVLSISPLMVTRDNLAVRGSRVLLRPETRWLAHGPAQGDAAVRVSAFGLYADGELVAFKARSRGQVSIAAGHQYDLAGDVLL